MPVLTRVDPLEIPMKYLYNAPFHSVTGYAATWTGIGGQALISASNLASQDSRAFVVACFEDRTVTLRTATNPASAQASEDFCVVKSALGDRYNLTWQCPSGTTDSVMSANVSAIPSGLPLSATVQLLRSRIRFPSAANDTTIGSARYGWNPINPLLGCWRSASLTPATMTLVLSDGSSRIIPSNGASSLDIQGWFNPPVGVVLPYGNGWRSLHHRLGANERYFLTFSEAQGFLAEDPITFAGDPVLDAAWTTLAMVRSTITTAVSQGWIVHFNNTPSVFPNQGLRIIYISKLTDTWRDIHLTGMDANSIARIAAGAGEAFKIVQSEFDGNFYGKAGAGAAAISDQILMSPSFTQRIGAPRGTLPDYHDYDMPYGMEFN